MTQLPDFPGGVSAADMMNDAKVQSIRRSGIDITAEAVTLLASFLQTDVEITGINVIEEVAITTNPTDVKIGTGDGAVPTDNDDVGTAAVVVTGAAIGRITAGTLAATLRGTRIERGYSGGPIVRKGRSIWAEVEHPGSAPGAGTATVEVFFKPLDRSTQ